MGVIEAEFSRVSPVDEAEQAAWARGLAAGWWDTGGKPPANPETEPRHSKAWQDGFEEGKDEAAHAQGWG